MLDPGPGRCTTRHSETIGRDVLVGRDETLVTPTKDGDPKNEMGKRWETKCISFCKVNWRNPYSKT